MPECRVTYSPIDLQVFVEMVKFARRFCDVSPLKEMISKPRFPLPSGSCPTDLNTRLLTYLAKEHNPGSEVQSDEQLAGE